MSSISRSKRLWLFFIAIGIAVFTSIPPYLRLMRSPSAFEFYGHIPLIPLVSLILLLIRRKEIFRGSPSYSPFGLVLTATGVGGLVARGLFPAEAGIYASLCVLSALSFLWGSYFLCFGKGGSPKAFFPLAFLAFAIPVPSFLMILFIKVLTLGSVIVTRLVFDLVRVPLIQDGPVFYLPGFFIKVAQECSGIRSSLALMITTVLASHAFLRGFWRQLLLISLVVPVAIFKNAIRIVMLSSLVFH
jgi:exosortase